MSKYLPEQKGLIKSIRTVELMEPLVVKYTKYLFRGVLFSRNLFFSFDLYEKWILKATYSNQLIRFQPQLKIKGQPSIAVGSSLFHSTARVLSQGPLP